MIELTLRDIKRIVKEFKKNENIRDITTRYGRFEVLKITRE